MWTDAEESEEIAAAVDLDVDLEARYAEKETQTVAGTFLLEEDYDLLVRKAEQFSSFKEDLVKLRQLFSSGPYNPEMDIDEFEKLCKKLEQRILFLFTVVQCAVKGCQRIERNSIK